MIDFTKAQVFDPPVEMIVSDYKDFKHQYKRHVFCIYPGLQFPILTVDATGKVKFWSYAKEITDTAETVLKDFISVWEDGETTMGTLRELFKRAKEVLA